MGSVNTWEELVEAYMSRFFPPALTTKRRGEMIVFKQGEGRVSSTHGKDLKDY